MAQIHDLTAVEQAARIRRGEMSSLEVVEHYLDRIDRLADTVGAFITVTADQAREQAREADRRVREADGDPDGLPPLLGVPTAIKDLNATAGIRTTFGSAVFADFVPKTSDEVVLRLERGGTISLGKTNTPEFGSPCYTEPDVAPPARTPYDLDRSAGGSSGGAAAAVATGLVPFAQGSDGGGSIRIPASVCGLVGLKPTRGRVSSAPLHADLAGLGVVGPLSRTVRDAAVMLDVLAGPAVGEQPGWAAPLPDDQSYLGWCARDPGHLRVGRFATPMIADTTIHPECLVAWEEASRLLAALGHDVSDATAPDLDGVVPRFEVVWSVGAAAGPVPADLLGLLRPLTRWLRERGESVSAPDYARAMVDLRQAAARTVRSLDAYDIVLTPTLGELPALIGGLRNDDDPAADFEAQKRFTPFTAAWNVTGMPAISLPLHWTPAGLPVGVMLAGRPGTEHILLAVAAQLESDLAYADHKPPIW